MAHDAMDALAYNGARSRIRGFFAADVVFGMRSSAGAAPWLNAGDVGSALYAHQPLLANVPACWAREWRPVPVVRLGFDRVAGAVHGAPPLPTGCVLHPEKTLAAVSRGESFADSRHDEHRGVSVWAVAPKRMRRTLKAIKAELRRRMHDKPVKTGQWLGRVLRGWLGYYAVPTSSRSLQRFANDLRRLWLYALRRRSQRDRFTWERAALARDHWPRVSILHPWPTERFAVSSRQEPDALTGTSGSVRGVPGNRHPYAFADS